MRLAVFVVILVTFVVWPQLVRAAEFEVVVGSIVTSYVYPLIVALCSTLLGAAIRCCFDTSDSDLRPSGLICPALFILGFELGAMFSLPASTLCPFGLLLFPAFYVPFLFSSRPVVFLQSVFFSTSLVGFAGCLVWSARAIFELGLRMELMGYALLSLTGSAVFGLLALHRSESSIKVDISAVLRSCCKPFGGSEAKVPHLPIVRPTMQTRNQSKFFGHAPYRAAQKTVALPMGYNAVLDYGLQKKSNETSLSEDRPLFSGHLWTKADSLGTAAVSREGSTTQINFGRGFKTVNTCVSFGDFCARA